MKQEVDFQGYWYIYIHSKLRERANNNYLRLDEAKSFLSEWRVPKVLWIVVIKELEQLDLIQQVEKDLIKFKPCKINLENTGRIYSKLGIF